MSSDNCNVYAIEARSENLQSQNAEKKEVEENHKVIVSNSDMFKKSQLECKELERAWELAKIDKGSCYIEKDLLYHKEKLVGETIAQLVVPKVKREGILKLEHVSNEGEHHAAKKTLERSRQSFYWEGMAKDAKKFCKSCLEYQLARKVKVSERVLVDMADGSKKVCISK